MQVYWVSDELVDRYRRHVVANAIRNVALQRMLLLDQHFVGRPISLGESNE